MWQGFCLMEPEASACPALVLGMHRRGPRARSACRCYSGSRLEGRPGPSWSLGAAAGPSATCLMETDSMGGASRQSSLPVMLATCRVKPGFGPSGCEGLIRRYG